MEFAVNYSPLLADLVQADAVSVDRFKCPAWPGLIAEARKTRPVYIHFPLTIGNGNGLPLNEENSRTVDLEWLADLMESSGTPLINTHFTPQETAFPEIDPASRNPRDADRVVSAALRDLEPLIHRFGAERVTVENIININGWLTLAVLPEVIRRVLDESGCGFLLDLSHARLAAANLKIDPRPYIDELPVDRIKEIHITGIQTVHGELYDRLLAAGDPGRFAERFHAQPIDHLAMAAADWPELEWMAAQIHQNRWREPWVTAFEYGGVGGFWEIVCDRAVYLDQLPRMKTILEGSCSNIGN